MRPWAPTLAVAGGAGARSAGAGLGKSFSLFPCQRRGPCAVVTRSRGPPSTPTRPGQPGEEGTPRAWAGRRGTGWRAREGDPGPSPARPALHVGSPALCPGPASGAPTSPCSPLFPRLLWATTPARSWLARSLTVWCARRPPARHPREKPAAPRFPGLRSEAGARAPATI